MVFLFRLVRTSSCTKTFQWKTKYACRLCDPSEDFANVFSECVDGQRTVSWVRKTKTCRLEGDQDEHLTPPPATIKCDANNVSYIITRSNHVESR